MGGMFDPVHDGHINAARLTYTNLGLERVLLLPCGSPVHREASVTPASHRIAMLQLIADEECWLQVDTRECDSTQPSWTWHSTVSIGRDHPESLLFLIMGMDSLLSLPGWYRWQDLLDRVNIVVIARPGFILDMAVVQPQLREELEKRLVSVARILEADNAGKMILLDGAEVEASSSVLRNRLASRQLANLQLHSAVQQYITSNDLYR